MTEHKPAVLNRLNIVENTLSSSLKLLNEIRTSPTVQGNFEDLQIMLNDAIQILEKCNTIKPSVLTRNT